MLSTRFTLNVRDFLKGLAVAILTSVLVIIQNTVAAGSLTFDWHAIAIAASTATVAYLIKNFFTDGVKVAEKTVEKAQADEAAKYTKI